MYVSWKLQELTFFFVSQGANQENYANRRRCWQGSGSRPSHHLYPSMEDYLELVIANPESYYSFMEM